MSAPLADKLNRLFEVMHHADEPMISNAIAAEEISRRRGISISPDDIQRLRAGMKRDATAQQLSAIAEFFGVPARYLVDPGGDPMVDAQLNLLEAMRDSGVRNLHSCGAPPTPQAMNWLAETISRLPPGN